MKTLSLLYHELRTEPSRYAYVIAGDAFERHCALYRDLRERADPRVLRPEITFDDGHLSDVRLALPILLEHSLTATFFITVGWTEQRVGFMNWDDLRTLHQAGQRLGAHGWSHKLLTRCTPQELDRELRGARERLEDGLGSEVRTMSLPGGRANAAVLRACEAAGFTQVYTSKPQAEELAGRPKFPGRLNLTSATDVAWLRTLLDPSSGVLARLERTERLKSTLRQALGDTLYHRVWSLVNRHEPEAPEIPAATPEAPLA